MSINKKKIVDRMMDYFHIINRKKLVKKSNKKYFMMLKENNIPVKRLSVDEKRQVNAIFKKYGFAYSYATHELAYSVTGKFTPNIIPEDMFRTEIEIYLNDYDTKYVLTDKNYFDIFMQDVTFPKAIVRNIEGVFYNHAYDVITREQALKIIKSYDTVVYKPSVENGFGRGVALVDVKTENPLDFRKTDYIIQERIVQHPQLAKMNESSVNVCRIVTVFLEDEVFVTTAALRIGAVGAFTDNSITEDGKGMIVVGIDENGRLRDTGVHSCGLTVHQTPGGISFNGEEVPKFKDMVEIAKKAHSRYPRIKFIAWDFCVDENNDVICLEYNARGPGVLYYQYVNGSLFGSYTDRILSYAKKVKDSKKLLKR